MISARIRVTQVKVSDRKVANAIATLPTVQPLLLAKANDVARTAQQRIAATPKRPVQKQRVAGYYFSERPDAIAKQVKVGGQEGGYIVTRTKRGTKFPVALVVADHPYSPAYIDVFASAVVSNAGAKWMLRYP